MGRIWSRTKKWILINDTSPSIGLFYHAFTGCDVVSAIHGKGEKVPGKHGMYGLRLLLFLDNSVNTNQYMTKTIEVFLISL